MNEAKNSESKMGYHGITKSWQEYISDFRTDRQL